MSAQENDIEMSAPQVTTERYRLVREAMLSVMPQGGPRRTPADIVRLVAPTLLHMDGLFPHIGSVQWFCASVQRDLEVRGLIERVPGKTPVQLRRTSR